MVQESRLAKDTQAISAVHWASNHGKYLHHHFKLLTVCIARVNQTIIFHFWKNDGFFVPSVSLLK